MRVRACHAQPHNLDFCPFFSEKFEDLVHKHMVSMLVGCMITHKQFSRFFARAPPGFFGTSATADSKLPLTMGSYIAQFTEVPRSRPWNEGASCASECISPNVVFLACLSAYIEVHS
jgi:hypothetical protein